MNYRGLRIVVLIPCYTEEVTIADTVAGFRAALPEAAIYVYDNNSTDRTAARAEEAGAIVRVEKLQGKGNVIRRMFSDIEADVYLMADGDGTYDPACARKLVELVMLQDLDMVVGRRISAEGPAYRTGHAFGNRLLTGFFGLFFGRRFSDVLSGYRAFSRRFVKSFPALSIGFEVETELTVHALTLQMPTDEINTQYFARPAGSASKLRTYRDGLRILATMVVLVKNEQPLTFFGLTAFFLTLSSVGLSIPVFRTYFETGLVPRFPTAILCASIVVLASLSLVCGLVLDTVSRGRREVKRLGYLRVPAPSAGIRQLSPTQGATSGSQ